MINDAVQSITPSMALIKKEYGEQFLYAFLTIMVSDVIDYFNVSKTMGERQVVDTVKMIAEDFYFLNIEDFKLCFNNAKKGRYGRVYDRIDGNVIFDWMNQYMSERLDVTYPERNNEPRRYDEYQRLSSSRNEDFEKFRVGYIVNKIRKHE